MKRLLIAIVLSAGVLLAWPAVADLVVSYTLRPVTAADISQVVFRPGNAAGDIVGVGYFNVKDSNGVVKEQGSVSVDLNAAQKTALINFINANISPAFNTQRGL